MSGALATAQRTIGAAVSVARTVGSIASAASSLLGSSYGSTASGGVGPWAAGMQTASWRGLPFGVRESAVRRGRKTAIHEYAFRDDVYVEDLGRGTRSNTFRGFILGDDVLAQHDAFLAAAEKAGPGTLVHPALGSKTCSLISFTAVARAEAGGAFELEFEFIEAGVQIYPTNTISTEDTTVEKANDATSGVSADFLSDVGSALKQGAAVVGQIASTVAVVGAYAQSLVGDALMVVGAVSGLAGDFGRFAQGSRTTPLPVTATVDTVLAGVITARTAVAAAAAAASNSVSGGSAAAIVAAQTTVSEAVRAACGDTADQIRLLTALATFQPPIPSYTDSLGLEIVAAAVASAAMCQRIALISLARATAVYQPTSYNDAVTVRDSVCGLLDAAALAAANAADDQTYSTFRELRTAVSNDLAARGSELPQLVTFNFRTNLPSLVMAWKLYQDPTRADELALFAGAANPGFMPTSVTALSG